MRGDMSAMSPLPTASKQHTAQCQAFRGGSHQHALGNKSRLCRRPAPLGLGCQPRQSRCEEVGKLLEAAAAESSFTSPEGSGMPEQLEVFPRRRERDPYRRLGVPRDASFEEVEDAKNFLVEQFRWHAESRESIELAYDTLLQEHLKKRHRFGFRPPKTGRKGDVQGEGEAVSVLDRVKEYVDPAVSSTTLINDGSIFVGLSIWTAFQATVDPTLPLGAAMAFCVWRLFDKRKKRNPDGPFWGGSPVWGALLTTLAGLLVGSLVAWAAVTYLPLPRMINAGAANLFLITFFLGATCIFVR